MLAIEPYPRFKAFSPGTGNPLVGGQLYTLLPGTTSTPPYKNFQKATYTSSTGAALNTNPIILDSNGEADIWGTGYYKFVLYDSLGNLIWSEDNVTGGAPLNIFTIASGIVTPALGTTSATITLAIPASDSNYRVEIQRNWMTEWRVQPGSQTTASVGIDFEVPSPSGAEYRWEIRE